MTQEDFWHAMVARLDILNDNLSSIHEQMQCLCHEMAHIGNLLSEQGDEDEDD